MNEVVNEVVSETMYCERCVRILLQLAAEWSESLKSARDCATIEYSGDIIGDLADNRAEHEIRLAQLRSLFPLLVGEIN